jgi:hypothetical protein
MASSENPLKNIDIRLLLSLLLGIPAVMIAASLYVFPEHKVLASVSSLILGLFIGFMIIVLVAQAIGEQKAHAALKGEQAEIEGKIEQKTATTVDIALLNMRKLDEYYALNKQQARRSFNVSIFAVAIGFATLIVSAMFFHDQKGRLLTGSLAGVLLQFIGGGFFYLYNKSLDQLNLFYGKLISLQDTMLALQLCEKLTTTKEETTKTIALELMKRSAARMPPPLATKQKNSSRTTGNIFKKNDVAEAAG